MSSDGTPPAGEGRGGTPPGGEDEHPAFDTSVAHLARVFFDGLELAEPGVVPVQEWRPGSASEASRPSSMWGGIARKG